MLPPLALTEVRRSPARFAVEVLLFIACYLVLEWASDTYRLGPFNTTSWNPSPALSIVWMLLRGLQFAPVVCLMIFAAELLIRDAQGGVWLTALDSAVLAAGYAVIAGALGYFLKGETRLRDTRLLWVFAAVMAIGIGIVTLLHVAILWGAGALVPGAVPAAVFRVWLSDVVGVLVTAPLLLVLADPVGRGRVFKIWRRPAAVLRYAVMIAAVFFVFDRMSSDPSRYFYVLFLPLIWIALRGGLAGAAIASAIVQVGVVLYGESMQTLAIVDLQARMAAFAFTGLFLGVMVDERARAAEELRQSLRLAAAGEMAGAIAHEINQPLAALGNYGRACQLMLGQAGGQPAPAELGATIEKMVGESKRAAEVIGRLRDLFRTGTTRLEKVTMDSLLEGARCIGDRLSAARQTDFRVEIVDDVPALLLDRLQVELVLRNLIENAFDAVARLPPEQRSVTLTITRVEGGRVLFCITDTGPGVTPAMGKSLFEPFSTSKPSGMGLGLAISRAIAEAHGGSLDAVFRGGGELRLLLPIEAADD